MKMSNSFLSSVPDASRWAVTSACRNKSHVSQTRPEIAFHPVPSVVRFLSTVTCLLCAVATATAQVAANAKRETIAGIDVTVLKTGVHDVVTLRGSIPAGDTFCADSNIAIATLTGRMLDKGTTHHDKFVIAQMLESVGASIYFYVDSNVLMISARCLRQDVPLVLNLLAEQLRMPAFSPEEFAKVKKQFAGVYQRALDNPNFRATDSFTRAVYPIGHPNRMPPPEELLAAADRATLDEVKAFYAAHYGPAKMRLVLVGDVDADSIKSEVVKDFAGWTGGLPLPHPAKAGTVDASHDQNVFMADKASVAVVWGQATGLQYRDPDDLALRIGTVVLGSGFTGRLMSNVRDKEGLTYGIYSAMSNDAFTDGDWGIYGAFAPALLEKGIASTQRQLTLWHDQGITPEELARSKTNIAGSYKVGLATTGGMADTILRTLHRGYDLDFVDAFPAKVAAVTVAEVNGSIKKYIKPDSLVLIKAGTVPGVVPGK